MKYFKYKVNHNYPRPGGFQEATDAENKIWSCLNLFHQEVSDINDAEIVFIGINNTSFYFDQAAIKRIWQEFITPRLVKRDIPHVAIFTYVINEIDLSFIPSWITIWAYETECSHHNSESLYTTNNGCEDRMCMIPYVLTPGTNPAAGLVKTTQVYSENFDVALWKNRLKTAFVGSLHAAGRPRISNRTTQVDHWQRHIGCDIYPDRSATEPNSTYAKYQFALVLRGDTPTRKAFYQAISSGAFPIITESAWQQYSELYRGHCESLADMVVVLPDKIELWDLKKINAQIDNIVQKSDELLPRLHTWVSKYLDYDNGGVVDAAMRATVKKEQRVNLPLIYIHSLEPENFYRPINVQISEEEILNKDSILESQYALEYIFLQTANDYPYRTACLKKAKAAVVPVHTFLSAWKKQNYYSVTDSANVINSAINALPSWKASAVPHYIGYADVLWDDERVFLPHVGLPDNTTVIALETCSNSTKQAAVPFPCGPVPAHSHSNERKLAVYIGRERENVIKYNIDFEIINTPGWHSTNIQNNRITKAYLEHKFSLQPHGDRATRRGFYQSIMCGCIPVITENCVNAYSEALATDVTKFCVVIPDWHEGVVDLLQNINFNEVRQNLPDVSIPDRILKIMKLK